MKLVIKLSMIVFITMIGFPFVIIGIVGQFIYRNINAGSNFFEQFFEWLKK